MTGDEPFPTTGATAVKQFLSRHEDRISRVLSGFDRLVDNLIANGDRYRHGHSYTDEHVVSTSCSSTTRKSFCRSSPEFEHDDEKLPHELKQATCIKARGSGAGLRCSSDSSIWSSIP